MFENYHVKCTTETTPGKLAEKLLDVLGEDPNAKVVSIDSVSGVWNRDIIRIEFDKVPQGLGVDTIAKCVEIGFNLCGVTCSGKYYFFEYLP